MAKHITQQLIPLNIAVLTVSDTRNAGNDSSGNYLAESVSASGHKLVEKFICIDDIYKIRHHLSRWIADEHTQVVLVTGGTGFTSRDSTPEAVAPLLDKTVEGFGELFRHISFADVGTSTIQSRALAGMANKTLIFCMPGSNNACKTAWEKIIAQQLDSRNSPCNFAAQLKNIAL